MTGVQAAEMLGTRDHVHAIPVLEKRHSILIYLILQPDMDITGHIHISPTNVKS